MSRTMRLERLQEGWLPLLAFCLLFGVVSVALGQDANFDLRNYHFYNAWAFDNNRYGLDLTASGLQTFLSPFLDMPFYWAVMYVDSPRWIAFWMGTVHGVGVFFVFRIIQLLLPSGVLDRGRHQLFALIVGATGTAAVPIIGSTMNDTQVAAGIMLALYLILLSEAAPRPRLVVIAISGLIVGSVAGLKLTMATYPPALALAVLFSGRAPRDALRSAIVLGLAGCAGMALTLGPWALIMYERYESPLFPFYNELFASPYWELVTFTDSRFGPKAISGWLLLPFHLMERQHGLVAELTNRDWRFATAYTSMIIGGLATLANRVRAQLAGRAVVQSQSPADKRVFRCLIIFVAVSYWIWLGVFSYYRYAIPIELLTGLVIIMMARRHVANRRLLNWGLAILLVLILATFHYPGWRRIPFGERYFEVAMPTVRENSLVVMHLSRPMAYLIPFFPQNTRFISPRNTIANPGNDNLLQEDIDRTLHQFAGPIYSLEHSEAATSSDNESLLAVYRLEREKKPCEPIHSNLERGHVIELCPLKRMADPNNDRLDP